GVEVFEAEGASRLGPGLVPGLEPDPLAELVGRCLSGPAEVAVQFEAQVILVPAGLGSQELPGDLRVPALALAPASAGWNLQLQVYPDVQGHAGSALQLTAEHPEVRPRVVQVSKLS